MMEKLYAVSNNYDRDMEIFAKMNVPRKRGDGLVAKLAIEYGISKTRCYEIFKEGYKDIVDYDLKITDGSMVLPVAIVSSTTFEGACDAALSHYKNFFASLELTCWKLIDQFKNKMEI